MTCCCQLAGTKACENCQTQGYNIITINNTIKSIKEIQLEYLSQKYDHGGVEHVGD